MHLNKNGFTVVEIVMVVLISALVALAVYRVFAIAVKADETMQVRMGTARALMATFRLVERDLNAMVPYDFGINSGLHPFDGRAQAIRMIVPTEDGLRAVRYAFDAVQGDLIRSEQPFIDFLDGEPVMKEQEQIIFLHPAIHNVRFFFGYLNAGEEHELVWKNQWQRDRLPFAVRLRLDVVQGKAPGSASAFERTMFIPHGDWGDL